MNTNQKNSKVFQSKSQSPTQIQTNDSRGLSLINKVPKKFKKYKTFISRDKRKRKVIVKVTDTRTGKHFCPDPNQTRLSHMRKRISSWAKIMNKSLLKRGKYTYLMITLTYSPDFEWYPNHIKNFMKRLRRKYPEIKAYAWVAEMQRRGAVHYHILVVVPKRTYIKCPDKSGLWKYGMTRVERAKKGSFYIVKYVGKEYQKLNYPKGIRIYCAVIGKNVIDEVSMLLFRLSSLPRWLEEDSREYVERFKEFPVKVGSCLWRVGDMFFESPYLVEIIRAGVSPIYDWSKVREQ